MNSRSINKAMTPGESIAQDSSATAAARQAWNTSKTARWSADKVALDEIAQIHHKKKGNKGRAFAAHMKQAGLMLGCPIAWISGVPWLKQSL